MDMTSDSSIDPVRSDAVWSLPADLQSVATLRNEVSGLLRGPQWSPPRLAEVRLAVSELASNVVQHSGDSTIDVRASVDDDGLWLDVQGGPAPGDVPAQLPPPSQWTGRGLAIAREVADRFEIVEHGDEVTIRCWFGPG